MWVIIASVIAGLIMSITVYETKWNNKSSGIYQANNEADNIAGNIIAYATATKEYAKAHNAYDVPLLPTHINSVLPYNLQQLADYRSTVVNYDTNKYELVSWDTLHKKTNHELVLNALTKQMETQRSISGNTNVVPLVIINTDCKAKIVNGYIGNVYKNIIGLENIFTNICKNVPQNFKVGKYNLLIQIID